MRPAFSSMRNLLLLQVQRRRNGIVYETDSDYKQIEKTEKGEECKENLTL